MKRGEVWWYERPQHKRRPVLILTRDEAIAKLDEVCRVLARATNC